MAREDLEVLAPEEWVKVYAARLIEAPAEAEALLSAQNKLAAILVVLNSASAAAVESMKQINRFTTAKRQSLSLAKASIAKIRVAQLEFISAAQPHIGEIVAAPAAAHGRKIRDASAAIAKVEAAQVALQAQLVEFQGRCPKITDGGRCRRQVGHAKDCDATPGAKADGAT
jgi:hypothetical protein